MPRSARRPRRMRRTCFSRSGWTIPLIGSTSCVRATGVPTASVTTRVRGFTAPTLVALGARAATRAGVNEDNANTVTVVAYGPTRAGLGARPTHVRGLPLCCRSPLACGSPTGVFVYPDRLRFGVTRRLRGERRGRRVLRRACAPAQPNSPPSSEPQLVPSSRFCVPALRIRYLHTQKRRHSPPRLGHLTPLESL